jgi:hypothetical protein
MSKRSAATLNLLHHRHGDIQKSPDLDDFKQFRIFKLKP